MNSNQKNTFFIKAALIGAALFFTACEIAETQELGEMNRSIASRTIKEANLIYKDSGKVKLDLKAPLIEEFEFIDSPFILMKKGVNVKFWGSHNPKPNRLRADWAKANDRNKFYEGKGNVVMINYDGDTLKTNHIFWDNKNRRIFTEDTVYLHRKDGTNMTSFAGLDASEDFKEYTFFKNKGELYYAEKDKNKTLQPTTKKRSDSLIIQPKTPVNKIKTKNKPKRIDSKIKVKPIGESEHPKSVSK